MFGYLVYTGRIDLSAKEKKRGSHTINYGNKYKGDAGYFSSFKVSNTTKRGVDSKGNVYANPGDKIVYEGKFYSSKKSMVKQLIMYRSSYLQI